MNYARVGVRAAALLGLPQPAPKTRGALRAALAERFADDGRAARGDEPPPSPPRGRFADEADAWAFLAALVAHAAGLRARDVDPRKLAACFGGGPKLADAGALLRLCRGADPRRWRRPPGLAVPRVGVSRPAPPVAAWAGASSGGASSSDHDGHRHGHHGGGDADAGGSSGGGDGSDGDATSSSEGADDPWPLPWDAPEREVEAELDARRERAFRAAEAAWRGGKGGGGAMVAW